MPVKEKAPTFDEYKELVRKRLRPKLSNISDAEFEKYFSREEKYLQDEYARDLECYENGDFALNVFLVGCPTSTAYALNLMY
jgi:ABC-type transporter MlaC component